MSRSTNTKAIGIFVTASIAVLVLLVLFFGSAKLFSQSIRYILFFEHSVNGLNVGSPVKYKGVPVGIVERILIRVEGQSRESTAIPVIVRIDRSRLTNRLGTSVEVFEPKFIQKMIEDGLVAQLEQESFITGQLFVEFSIQSEQAGNFVKNRNGDGDYGMVEIPTLGSSFCEITNDVGSVISLFAEFDFQKTYQTINSVLESLLLVLQGIDAKELSRSITGAADQITVLLESGELEASLSSARSALEQLDQTLSGLNRLVANGNDLIAPESPTRHELQNSLRELSQTAQSLRLFINYLERNPSALLTGRPEQSR